jgi:hypothetical protein
MCRRHLGRRAPGSPASSASGNAPALAATVAPLVCAHGCLCCPAGRHRPILSPHECLVTRLTQIRSLCRPLTIGDHRRNALAACLLDERLAAGAGLRVRMGAGSGDAVLCDPCVVAVPAVAFDVGGVLECVASQAPAVRPGGSPAPGNVAPSQRPQCGIPARRRSRTRRLRNRRSPGARQRALLPQRARRIGAGSSQWRPDRSLAAATGTSARRRPPDQSRRTKSARHQARSIDGITLSDGEGQGERALSRRYARPLAARRLSAEARRSGRSGSPRSSARASETTGSAC